MSEIFNGGGSSGGMTYTGWTDYSGNFAFSSSNSNSTLGTNSTLITQYRRMGANMEFKIIIVGTGGTNGTGRFTFSLPTGLSVNTSLTTTGDFNAVCGVITAHDGNSGANAVGTVYPYDTSHFAALVTVGNAATADLGSAVIQLALGTYKFSLYGSVPISGWS